MDTAQRGMGLPGRRRASSSSAAAARPRRSAPPGLRGGTDQLERGRTWGLDDIAGAYAEQVGLVEGAGAQAVVLASHAMAAAAAGDADATATSTRACSGGDPAGDPPLARRGVRPGAARLLGQH
jgi:hypothetical protein